MAPRMREIEEQFKNQINFVVVDGSAEENYDLVSTRHEKRRFALPFRVSVDLGVFHAGIDEGMGLCFHAGLWYFNPLHPFCRYFLTVFRRNPVTISRPY